MINSKTNSRFWKTFCRRFYRKKFLKVLYNSWWIQHSYNMNPAFFKIRLISYWIILCYTNSSQVVVGKRSVVNNRHRLSIIPRTNFFFLSQSIFLPLYNKRRLNRRKKNKNMQVILNLFCLAFVHITSSSTNMIFWSYYYLL